MPTPTPNMPTQSMYSINCHIGGSGRPIQVIAWITTAMPLMPATDAAMVWI